MKHYATYTHKGITAMVVGATQVRIRGIVYDLTVPVTVGLVKALIEKVAA